MSTSNQIEELRNVAQEWNLECDKKLLGLLRNIHQKLTSKCSEVDSKLLLMSSTLDNANVSLENVNNRLSSLNNVKFIENRVREDDEVFDTPVEEAPQQKQVDRMKLLSDSLVRLEQNYDSTIILDSDSDSDGEESTILIPKSKYKDRPLPYIIGSENWLNKWHAGLVPSDSDDESAISRSDHHTSYSSDSSICENENMDEYNEPSHSEAELSSHEEDLYKPEMKVYQPYNTPNIHLFSNDPPPLPMSQSDTESSADSDIFAEIHNKHDSMEKYKIVQSEKDDTKKPAEGIPISDDIKEDANNFVPLSREPFYSDETVEKDAKTKNTNEVQNKLISELKAKTLKKSSDKVDQENVSNENFIDNVEQDNVFAKKSIVSEKQGINSPKSEKKERNPLIEQLFSITGDKETKTKVSEAIKAQAEVKVTEKESIKQEKPKRDIFDDIFDDIDDLFVTKKDKTAQNNKHDIFADDTFKANENQTFKPNSLFDSDDELFKNDSPTDLIPDKTTKSAEVEYNVLNRSDSIICSNTIDDSDTKSKSNYQINCETSPDLQPKNKKESFNQNIIISPNRLEVKDTNVLNVSEKEVFSVDKKSENKNPEEKHKSIFEDSDTDSLLNESQISDITTDQTPDIKPEDTKSQVFKPRTILDSDSDDDYFMTAKTSSNATSILEKKISNSVIEDSNKNTKVAPEDKKNDVIITKFDELSASSESKVEIKSIASIGTHDETQEKTVLSKTQTNNEILENSPTEEKIFPNIEKSIIHIPPNLNTSIEETNIIFFEPPPLIEKKIPKNQNINALFGDDSDDESFFKSDPVVTDEKPFNDSSYIFHDEPPELDDPIIVKTDNANIKSDTSSTDLVDNSRITHTVTEDKATNISKIQNKININVNSLLPGSNVNLKGKIEAAKSIPKEDSIQTTKEEIETDKLTKDTGEAQDSIRFHKEKVISIDDATSTILDNTISKDRAKIQVKRRPSTRRARIEAVRKSVVDIDITDNVEHTEKILKVNEDDIYIYREPIKSYDRNSEVKENMKASPSSDANNKDGDRSIATKIQSNPSIANMITAKKLYSTDIDVNKLPDNYDTSKENQATKKTMNQPTNEEETNIIDDIFKNLDENNTKIVATAEVAGKNSNKSIFEDKLSAKEGDQTNKIITLPTTSKESINNDEILGKSDSDNTQTVTKTEKVDKKPNKSIFDDSSDEDLFKGATKKKVVSKSHKARSNKSLFSSDSDDSEIFETKKSNVPNKQTLFDDDDDDLFGSKTEKSQKPETVSKPSKSLFDDPLSLFDD